MADIQMQPNHQDDYESEGLKVEPSTPVDEPMRAGGMVSLRKVYYSLCLVGFFFPMQYFAVIFCCIQVLISAFDNHIQNV